MNDREHYLYWKQRGVNTVAKYKTQLKLHLASLPKTETAKSMKTEVSTLISLERGLLHLIRQSKPFKKTRWASWAHLCLHALPFAREQGKEPDILEEEPVET